MMENNAESGRKRRFKDKQIRQIGDGEMASVVGRDRLAYGGEGGFGELQSRVTD
jgi:hypothetical protein